MDNKFNLDFIERYKYPSKVKEHFEEILSYIDYSKVKSVLLTGSTSRGELSYSVKNQKLTLYSDYEFIIISNGNVDISDIQRLEKSFNKLEEKYSNNVLFHIDFAYIDIKRLRKLPPHLKHFETKTNGITIFGENLIHLLPDITLDNLDIRDLNEILIWRLWSMLLYFPKGLLSQKGCLPADEHIYKYVLCRNVLDLATWILPLKGVLLSSFKARSSYINSSLSNLQDEYILDRKFVELLNECMAGKFNLEFSRGLTDLYMIAIHSFLKARQYLLTNTDLSMDNGNHNNMLIIEKSRRFFHDFHYRRKGYEVLYVLKNYRNIDVIKSIQWVFLGKYGLMLEFLYSAHLALSSYFNDDSKSTYHLDNARSILTKLITRKNQNILISDNFIESWLALRKGFAGFLIDYFPSVKSKAAYIYSILD